MSNTIIRMYTKEDEQMLTEAQVFSDNLALDMAAFAARFPWITAPFNTGFIASINLANSLPLDSVVLSNVKILTSDVNAQVAIGADALRTLGIYAKLTYPTDTARQRAFGQDNWTAANNDQEKMMNALEHANTMAAAAPFNAALLAKGYTAAEVSNLLTIANNIRTKNSLQEDALSRRPVSTQDRIVQYNAVWATMQTINTCSKVVFMDNAAKLEQYMLYSTNVANTTINIVVLKNSTTIPLENVTVQLTNTSLAAAVTDSNGLVVFQSVNMPDSIDVHLDGGSDGSADYLGVSIVKNTTNDLQFQLPQ